MPDSLLINGIGRFICSMAVPARPLECEDTDERNIPSLLRHSHSEQQIRLRIVNVGYLSPFSFRMHQLIVRQHIGGFHYRIRFGVFPGVDRRWGLPDQTHRREFSWHFVSRTAIRYSLSLRKPRPQFQTWSSYLARCRVFIFPNIL